MKISLYLVFLITFAAFAGCAKKSATSSEKEIHWMSYDEATAACKKKPKKIFIDVYTSWCGWCKVMDKKTFTDPTVIEKMNKNFYAVKLNAEGNKDLIYKGQEMKESDLARSIFGVSSYPTTLYLDSDETLLSPIAGYLEVDVINPILDYFGKDIYKNKTWEQFQREQESKQE